MAHLSFFSAAAPFEAAGANRRSEPQPGSRNARKPDRCGLCGGGPRSLHAVDTRAKGSADIRREVLVPPGGAPTPPGTVLAGHGRGRHTTLPGLTRRTPRHGLPRKPEQPVCVPLRGSGG